MKETTIDKSKAARIIARIDALAPSPAPSGVREAACGWQATVMGILHKHARHIDQSPGVPEDRRNYAQGVIADIMADVTAAGGGV